MSKAILVIDMPMNCLECRFRITHYANDKPYLDTCMVKDETSKNGCPLRPLRLPNVKEQVPLVIKNENDSLKEVYEYGVIDGYNECVREVLGWNESNPQSQH